MLVGGRGGRRIRRSDVYSSKLGVVYVATVWLLDIFASAAMAAVSNKFPLDPLPTRWSSPASVMDLSGWCRGAQFPMDLSARGRLPGGGAVGAAAAPQWTFVLPVPLLPCCCLLRLLRGRRGEMYRSWPAFGVGVGSWFKGLASLVAVWMRFRSVRSCLSCWFLSSSKTAAADGRPSWIRVR